MELFRHTFSRIIFMLFLIGVLTLPSGAIGLNLYLNIDLTTTQQTAQLILETDKQIYLLGENVTIILKNVGNSSVRIGGFPAWQIFTYPEEEPVYPKVFATLAWNLEPGENNTFIWNQYNQFKESFCTPETYIAKYTQDWELSTLFQIAPSTPAATPTATATPIPTPTTNTNAHTDGDADACTIIGGTDHFDRSCCDHNGSNNRLCCC